MNSPQTPLAPFEWNFAPVPAEELDICFFYEYAREHAKTSKRWRQLMQKVCDKKKTILGAWSNYRSIFGNAEALPWLFNSDFAGTPWQAVDKRMRQDQAKEFNARRGQPKSFQEFNRLNITLQRDMAEYAEAGVTDFDSWVLLARCFNHDDAPEEYGFFAINWNYPDGRLLRAFAKWLKEKRGDRRPRESRGKSKTRQHLRALGAKRLLDSGFTVAKAIEHTQKCLPKPLYDSEQGWSKAKCETVPAILNRLFPAKK